MKTILKIILLIIASAIVFFFALGVFVGLAG